MLPLKDEKAPLKFPLTTLFIILLNCYFFLNGKFGGFSEAYIPTYGLIPSEFFDDPINQAPTVLISLFLHAGWGHLIGNMLFLWVFGNRIENLINPLRFLFFYLACGILSSIGFSFLSDVKDIPIVGASGAISGVLGAYLILFPKAQISTLFFWVFYFNILKTPAFVYIFFWVFWQIFAFVSVAQTENQIAWLGHLIGFVAGIIIIFLLKKPQNNQKLKKTD
jgi:membrane associated rhomboid family serine protease